MEWIDKTVLPVNGAFYKVLTERVEKYVESIDEKIYKFSTKVFG